MLNDEWGGRKGGDHSRIDKAPLFLPQSVIRRYLPMKNAFLFLLLSTGSLLSGADPSPFQAQAAPETFPRPALPAEITQYYHDVNFAACFSTPDERTLVGHMTETSATNKLSERLKTLMQAVRRIRAASASIDPHFAHGSADSGIRDEELTEIASVQRSGDRIQIGVCTRTVSTQTRTWLVANYENVTKQPASGEYSASLAAVFKQTPRREMHTWNLVNGQWVRKEAAAVLLNFMAK